MAENKYKARKRYKMSIVAKDMQNKVYRKYLYPQEIDGIVFDDDVERKLSESSWFRCLKPEQQLVIEKQMRLRAQGSFNQEILHFTDPVNDPAPAIPKQVITRLTEALTPAVLKFYLQLIPYISTNDGILRNAKRHILTLGDFSDMSGMIPSLTRSRLCLLHDKRLIFFAIEPKGKPDKADIFADIGDLENYDIKVKAKFHADRKVLIYMNPYVVFMGQYLDLYIHPYFVNSGWYVINPYAAKIKHWIEANCK